MTNESVRSVKKNKARKLLLGALAASALLSGLAATPALADRGHHHGYYERWDHRHHWRPRPYGYWAPGYYGPPPVVYVPPPPVYYEPPPPPPPVYYGGPSLNVVIPIR